MNETRNTITTIVVFIVTIVVVAASAAQRKSDPLNGEYSLEGYHSTVIQQHGILLVLSSILGTPSLSQNSRPHGCTLHWQTPANVGK